MSANPVLLLKILLIMGKNENAKTNILQSLLGVRGEKLNRQRGVGTMHKMQGVSRVAQGD